MWQLRRDCDEREYWLEDALVSFERERGFLLEKVRRYEKALGYDENYGGSIVEKLRALGKAQSTTSIVSAMRSPEIEARAAKAAAEAEAAAAEAEAAAAEEAALEAIREVAELEAKQKKRGKKGKLGKKGSKRGSLRKGSPKRGSSARLMQTR